ncbi:MAG: glycosyltransferase [Actinobacteria bacterium]|nr:glycosyltransferase [Actinomycetota bacterium]
MALVTPFDWGIPNAVNQHIADLAKYLLAVGHRPTVVGSSSHAAEIKRIRPLLQRRNPLAFPRLEAWGSGAMAAPELLPTPGLGPLDPSSGIPVLSIGKAIPMRVNRGVVSVSLPVDITSRLERLLGSGVFDIVHVHEPAAPSLSFTAVRVARNPVVATFHLTSAGLFSYEHSRVFVQRIHEQIDRSLVTSERAADTLRDFIGGDYEVVPLASALGPTVREIGNNEGVESVLVYVYRGDDRRALALLLRMMAARWPANPPRMVIAVHKPSRLAWPPRREPRRLSDSVEWVSFSHMEELSPLLASAHGLILPFLGGDWLPTALEEGLAAALPVAAPAVPLSRDVLGPRGILFAPDQEASVMNALRVLTETSGGGQSLSQRHSEEEGHGGREPGHGLSWDVVGPLLRKQYQRALAGRSDGRPATVGRRSPTDRSRAFSRRRTRPVLDEAGRIHVDLHVHTAYSKDSASSVAAVLRTARDVGLGAVAITDHNTIAGALAAKELAGEDVFVVVGEEIMTRQGEVIGLFLEEEVPPGLSFDETLGLIKAQGALVYVPHPFDGLHSTPPYRLLVDNVHRIDVIEVFNARLAVPTFNVRAERFAAKYGITAGAGSDAHVIQGLGTAMVRMRPFSNPEDFMESLRTADILADRKNVLYLTSLKLLQTSLDRVRSTPAR